MSMPMPEMYRAAIRLELEQSKNINDTLHFLTANSPNLDILWHECYRFFFNQENHQLHLIDLMKTFLQSSDWLFLRKYAKQKKSVRFIKFLNKLLTREVISIVHIAEALQANKHEITKSAILNIDYELINFIFFYRIKIDIAAVIRGLNSQLKLDYKRQIFAVTILSRIDTMYIDELLVNLDLDLATKMHIINFITKFINVNPLIEDIENINSMLLDDILVDLEAFSDEFFSCFNLIAKPLGLEISKGDLLKLFFENEQVLNIARICVLLKHSCLFAESSTESNLNQLFSLNLRELSNLTAIIFSLENTAVFCDENAQLNFCSLIDIVKNYHNAEMLAYLFYYLSDCMLLTMGQQQAVNKILQLVRENRLGSVAPSMQGIVGLVRIIYNHQRGLMNIETFNQIMPLKLSDATSLAAALCKLFLFFHAVNKSDSNNIYSSVYLYNFNLLQGLRLFEINGQLIVDSGFLDTSRNNLIINRISLTVFAREIIINAMVRLYRSGIITIAPSSAKTRYPVTVLRAIEEKPNSKPRGKEIVGLAECHHAHARSAKP